MLFFFLFQNVQITSMDEDVQKLAVQCACKEIVSATMVHVNLVVHPDSEDENAMKVSKSLLNLTTNVTKNYNLIKIFYVQIYNKSKYTYLFSNNAGIELNNIRED